jgi:hypothetical protein
MGVRVSRETVQLFFLLAALHDTDILSANIQNAYLNAPVKEKLYMIAGREFGPWNEGCSVMIVRALYENAYLNAAVKEKLYMIAGREFGPEADPPKDTTFSTIL